MQKHIYTLLLALLLLFPVQTVSAELLSAGDTVAGLGTEIVLKGAQPNAALDIVVTPPVGPEIAFPITADAAGEVMVWLDSMDVQRAGTYTVQLEQDGSVLPITATFSVLPDRLSEDASNITIRDAQIQANGKDATTVRVTLKDQYGNPLAGRPVQLISSIGSDTVIGSAKETADDGTLIFTIKATEVGTRNLRAIDLITGTILMNTVELMVGDISQAVGGPYDQQFYNPGGYPYAAPMPMIYPQAYPTPYFQPPTPYPLLPAPYPPTNPYSASILGGGKRFFGQVSQFDSPVDRFVIEVTNRVDPLSIQADDDFASISITAVDSAGNRVDDYTGTVLLSATDPEAILPVEGIVQFEPRNLGKKPLTLGLAFHTPGEQWLRAVDSENPDIEGILKFKVIGTIFRQAAKLITILEPKMDSLLNVTEITVKGEGPPFINISISGGRDGEVESETDSDGFFSVALPLDTSKTEHTIKAEDKSGKYESEEITFSIDVTPPEITRVSFTPENPEEDTDVLLVVETEPDLAVSTMKLEDEDYDLTVNGSDPTKYQVLFQAPAAGVFNPVIILTDALGNTTEQTANFVVKLKGLPTVQNVIVEAQANAIALSWDAITSIEIDAYRIYVGSSPTDFLYTLDTDRPTVSATVAGLRPGTTYYFAITALQGKRESDEKSDIVPGTVLGLNLDVTPQDSALLLEWTSIGDTTPLSSYILEYGVEPEILTEKRTLNGELRAFTLRDLINGQIYYLKLTPITTTGKVLEDFTVTGQGTPTSRFAGFRPTAGDPIPFEFIGYAAAAPEIPYEPAPRTPQPPALSDEGIPLPAWWIAALIASAAFGLHLYQRRRMQQMALFLQKVESRYRS